MASAMRHEHRRRDRDEDGYLDADDKLVGPGH